MKLIKYMEDIQIGDIVQIGNKSKRNPSPLVGKVIKIRSSSWPYRVQFDDGRYADYGKDELVDYERMRYLRMIFAAKNRAKKRRKEKEEEEKRKRQMKINSKDTLGKMLSNKMTKSDIMKLEAGDNIEKGIALAAVKLIGRLARAGGKLIKPKLKQGALDRAKYPVKLGGKSVQRGVLKIPYTSGKIGRGRMKYLRSKSGLDRFLARHPGVSAIGAGYGVKTLRRK